VACTWSGHSTRTWTRDSRTRQCNVIAHLDYCRVASTLPSRRRMAFEPGTRLSLPWPFPLGYSAAQCHAEDVARRLINAAIRRVAVLTACFCASTSSLSLLCCMVSNLVATRISTTFFTSWRALTRKTSGGPFLAIPQYSIRASSRAQRGNGPGSCHRIGSFAEAFDISKMSLVAS
jgi:hypothetical protein